MNNFLFYLKGSFIDLWTNKGRSFLTSLGIIIGVYSVILLMSLGEGLKIYIQQQFDSLGSNLIFVIPGKISGGNTPGSMGGGAKFTYSDYQKLERGLPEALVVPSSLKTAAVSSRKDSISTTLLGSNQEISQVYNLINSEGRFFSKSEELSGRKVAVLGSQAAEDLFGGPAVGQTIDVNNLKFRVIGVLEPKGGGGMGGPSFDSYIYTPYKAVHLLSNDRFFYAFYIKAQNADEIDITTAKAERILLKNYNLINLMN